jgi:hypothetical protein
MPPLLLFFIHSSPNLLPITKTESFNNWKSVLLSSRVVASNQCQSWQRRVRLHSKPRKKCKFSILFLELFRGFECKRTIICRGPFLSGLEWWWSILAIHYLLMIYLFTFHPILYHFITFPASCIYFILNFSISGPHIPMSVPRYISQTGLKL